MGRMIQTDFKKIFGDYHIYLCILALGFICSLAYLEMTSGQIYFFDFTNEFTILLSNEIILFCFLICIVGGSFLYCSEEKYGYIKFEIQRVGIKIYTISKLVTSVASGFIVSISGMAMSVITMIINGYLRGNTAIHIWPSLNDLEQFIWQIFLFSLLCGLLSAMGFLVTTFYTNYYVAMTAPILIYYALLSLYVWIPVPEELQISKVFLVVSSVDDKFEYYGIYAILYTICFIIIFYQIAKKKIQRRLEHV